MKQSGTDIQPLPRLVFEPPVRQALMEDMGCAGDITSSLVLPSDQQAAFVFRAREEGRMAGMMCALCACELVDPSIKFEIFVPDGADFEKGENLARIEGPASSLLMAERTALNFLTHLCGVATLTRSYVQAVQGTLARIASTRKTLPGLRALQKHAVLLGGGSAHRYGLGDAILIKDNHIALAGSFETALSRVRMRAGHMTRLAVEVDDLEGFDEALAYEPDVILLDNMSLQDLREAVKRAANRVILEASGGVNPDTVQEIAETGVDVISVGALTHSARALDLGLDAVGT